jgi:hypothetical protein
VHHCNECELTRLISCQINRKWMRGVHVVRLSTDIKGFEGPFSCVAYLTSVPSLRSRTVCTSDTRNLANSACSYSFFKYCALNPNRDSACAIACSITSDSQCHQISAPHMERCMWKHFTQSSELENSLFQAILS